MFDFKFPPEIEDQIFEWATFLSPCDACHLAVTCKRLQIRVEYIIDGRCQTLRIHTQSTPRRILCNPGAEHLYHVQCEPELCKVSHCQMYRCSVCDMLDIDESSIRLWRIVSATNLDPCWNLNEQVHCERNGSFWNCFPSCTVFGMMGEAKEPLLPLDWLPNLLTMQVDLNNPRSDQWLEDTKLAISTALFLEMVIFDVNPGFLDEVESRRPELGEEAAIWIETGSLNMGFINGAALPTRTK
ncbi:hypothetical protein H2248_003008 [Termitomyces sp. 'cryptogamus']|nr:hypothetical protein H2248_003008 [Termitomyces sp. 'cryptogamus']